MFARDMNAVHERAVLRLAMMRVDRADRLPFRVFDDPQKSVLLQHLERLLPEKIPDAFLGDGRPDELQAPRHLAIEIPTEERLRIRRLDAAQTHFLSLPKIHPSALLN